MKKRGIVLLLTGLIMFLGACEINKETQKEDGLTQIKIADLRSEFWLPAYVAEQKGFFKEEGLDAEFVVFKDGPVAFQSMHAGEVDYCMISTEPIVMGYDKGLKSNIIVATMKTKPFMLISSSSVKTIADLKGKKIAAGTPGSSPYAFISAILKKNGLDPLKDVELLNMDYSATLIALERDEIQATFLDTTRRNEENVKGTNVLFDVSDPAQHLEMYGSELYESSIITASESFINEQPEVNQHFVNAIRKAMAWEDQQSDEDVAKLIAPMFDGNDMTDIVSLTRNALSSDGYISKEGYQAIADFCLAEKLIEKPVSYEQIIDMTFVDNYQDEAK